MTVEPPSGDVDHGPTGARSWQPLSARLGGTPIDETWYEGIPNWIIDPVRDWLYERLRSQDSTRERLFARLHYESLSPFERVNVVMLSPKDLLDWIDSVLHITAGEPLAASSARDLETFLREGHSVWKVSDSFDALERRQEATVTAAAHQAGLTAKSSGRAAAADHLQKAWGKTYGLHPDPSEAYGDAILAVEAVAIPAIEPTNAAATLGTVYGQLKSQGSLYELAILSKTGDQASVESVTQLVGLLWEGHTDRHEGNVPAVPITQEAAEMAVHAAAMLVQWFSSGAVQRVGTPKRASPGS